MSTNIRAFDALNLTEILIDVDAPLSTQRDANETYEDDFEHDISFTDQEIAENGNNEAPETEDKILAKYARAFEEESQEAPETEDEILAKYALAFEEESQHSNDSIYRSQPHKKDIQEMNDDTSLHLSPEAIHEGTTPIQKNTSSATADTQHSSSPISSASLSIQHSLMRPPRLSSSVPMSHPSCLKASRSQTPGGMFSKVRRVPKPIPSHTVSRSSKTASSPPQPPPRQLPDDLIQEVYALHAKLEAAYAAPYAINARKINNAIPITSQHMKLESCDIPVKEVSVAINDYTDVIQYQEFPCNVANVAETDLSATKACFEDPPRLPVYLSSAVMTPKRCRNGEEYNNDPITTTAECDSTLTANSIYTTFLSDIIGLAKERSAHANTVEELTMHRVLAQFLHENFASRGTMERITADMVYATRCSMK